jgi:hypothetical protein
MTTFDLRSPSMDSDDTYVPDGEATEVVATEDHPTVIVPDSGPTQGPGKVGVRRCDLGIYHCVIGVSAVVDVTNGLGCRFRSQHPNSRSHPRAILPDAACRYESDAP